MAYHAGEIAVQAYVGVQTEASRIGNILTPDISAPAQNFLRSQNMLVVSTIDAQGRVWASLLVGEPGFIRIVDETTLEINATPRPGDPLHENLSSGALIGMVSLDPANVKRVRINGRVIEHTQRLLVRTEQVYFNCPKYIQRRELTPHLVASEPSPPVFQMGKLFAHQQQWIKNADTFFIATLNPESGADASHRGGYPGFVHIVGENLLLFPDYKGNMMFQTLGNLAVDPRAGLLFIDFEQGQTLQLTGKASIIWDEKLIASLPGAQRLLLFEIANIIESSAGDTIRGQFIQYSPYNPT